MYWTGPSSGPTQSSSDASVDLQPSCENSALYDPVIDLRAFPLEDPAEQHVHMHVCATTSVANTSAASTSGSTAPLSASLARSVTELHATCV